MRKKLLLHICCAPDAAYIPDMLADEWDVTCFFYNPNIFPSDEHDKRAAEMKRLAQEKGYKLVSPDYQPDRFHDWADEYLYQPEKAGRCSRCYHMRLEETARYAADHGFDAFASVLTVSPHKSVDRVNRIGNRVADQVAITYLESDFKKQGGFQKSVDEARQHDLYRQDYCGCESSLRYREMFKAVVSQEQVALVRGDTVGIHDVREFRKWLDRNSQASGFLFYGDKPTRAVFREAYAERILLEPSDQVDWRERILLKKKIRVLKMKLNQVSSREMFLDPM